MDGIGAGLHCSVEDLVDDEVGLGCCAAAEGECLIGQLHVQGVSVRVGIHGDRRQPGVAAGSNDPNRDLAAVGDQDGAHMCSFESEPESERVRRESPLCARAA